MNAEDPALPDVHQRHHRQTQGLPARHRRLPGLCHRHLEIRPGTSIPKTSTGAWPISAGSRDTPTSSTVPCPLCASSVIYEGFELSGSGPPVAHRPEPGCQHLPHGSHGHSRPAQDRPGRTGQVQLQIQTHDHRRRAHRARSLEMVLQGSSARKRPHRGHLVADRNRRLPVQHPAGHLPDEPGSAGKGMPGIHPIILDDEGKNCRGARARPATSASRTPGRACSRPSGATATVS